MQSSMYYYSDDSSLRNGGGGGGPECLECVSSWRSIGFGEGDSHNEDCWNEKNVAYLMQILLRNHF